MVALYKDPKGKNVLKAVKSKSTIAHLRSTGCNTITVSAVDTDQECDNELTIHSERG